MGEAQMPLPESIEDKLVTADGANVVLTAFNHRGNLLAGGCQSGAIVVWDFETHGIIVTLKGHSGCLTSLSWTRSSRRLLSSAADKKLILWDVLQGTATASVQLDSVVVHATLHPRKRLLALACLAVSDSATQTFLVDLGGDGSKPAADRLTALPEAASGGGEAESGYSESGGGPSLATVATACFAADGRLILVGSSKGTIRCLRTDGLSEAFSVRVPGQATIKSLVASRDGKSFLCNAADRVIRAYNLERLLNGESVNPRELQDVVNRVPWVLAGFSPGQHDSEHIVGTADSPNELLVYIWDMHGHLITVLGQGTKVSDGALHFACHPTRPILATCAKSGAVYVWTKRYSENWSAFAPDFKELEENEEYDEKEDEFDIKHYEEENANEEEETVEILKVEDRSGLAHVPDEDDDDAELFCLPTVPEAEATEEEKAKMEAAAAAGGAGAGAPAGGGGAAAAGGGGAGAGAGAGGESDSNDEEESAPLGKRRKQ